MVSDASGSERGHLGSHLSSMQGIQRSDLQFANSLKLLSDAIKEAEAHPKRSATSINVDMPSVCYSGKHQSVAVATFWEDVLRSMGFARCTTHINQQWYLSKGSAGSAWNARRILP